MSTIATFISLQKSLLRPSAVYAEARARYAALAPYETPTAVLAAMDRGSPLDLLARNLIVCALVTEAQRTRHPVWSTLLLAVFEPMLIGVRRAVRTRSIEDADQNVILAFLEAVQHVTVDRFTGLALRSATRKAFFRATRAERGLPSNVHLDDDEEGTALACDPFGEGLHADVEPDEVARLVQEVGGAPLLDAMVALHDAQITLVDHVAQTHPDATPKARAAVYESLKRGRALVAQRLSARRARRAGHAA